MEDFKFKGIDSDLINRIYFPTAAEKAEYLTEVQKILTNLSIGPGKDRMDVINRIADADVDLEFLRDILAFTGDLQYSKNSDTNNYYTNCQLCEYNVQRKLESGVNNFQNEETLVTSLMSIDLAGYAKASLIFKMGQAFSKLNLWEKVDYYFDIFRNTSFELSPATVANFYRGIAEIYLESGGKEIAINWLKAGVLLNPKLAVKKMIKQLKPK